MCRMRLKKRVDSRRPGNHGRSSNDGRGCHPRNVRSRRSKKKVSERLLELGIPGLRYLDGTSRKRVKAPTTTSSGIRKSSTASRCWSATARSLTPSGGRRDSLQPRRQPTLRRPRGRRNAAEARHHDVDGRRHRAPALNSNGSRSTGARKASGILAVVFGERGGRSQGKAAGGVSRDF